MQYVPPKPVTETDSGFTAGDPCNAWADIPDQRLLAELHEELHRDYNPIAAQPDLGGNPNRYTTARRIMFTEVERYQARDGSYVVECVYTGNTATAPRTDDPDRDFINCEHVLPRARMANEEGQPIVYSHQQSDIHNLMPTTPGSNSTRGSLRYGDVVTERNLDHLPSMSGDNASGEYGLATTIRTPRRCRSYYLLHGRTLGHRDSRNRRKRLAPMESTRPTRRT